MFISDSKVSLSKQDLRNMFICDLFVYQLDILLILKNKYIRKNIFFTSIVL